MAIKSENRSKRCFPKNNKELQSKLDIKQTRKNDEQSQKN